MFNLLVKNIKLILLWGAILGGLSLIISALIPKYYNAESQALIIVRGSGATDPYTQARSAEQVGQNLSQIMQTQNFIDKVFASNLSFDRTPWANLDSRAVRKQWAKNVQGSMVYGTSLLKVSVYGKTKDDAKNFVVAVTQALADHGWEYIGSDVLIKVVDTPITSPWQTRPNILVNTIIGFAAGLLLAVLWVVRYKRKQLFGAA